MLEETWLLIIGIPVIVVLTVMAVRRARALAARIAEVREEMAKNPPDPYQALSELYAEQEGKPRRKGTRRAGR
jgi:hypothetical protein